MGVGVLVPSISRALSGAAVTASLGTLTADSQGTVPTASEDAWTKLSGTFSFSDERSGPKEPFHFRADVIDTTGEVFVSWKTPSSGPVNRNGSFLFNPDTGEWRRTNTEATGIDADGNVRALGQRENLGSCYDADRHGIWYGPGTPNGIGGSLPPSPMLGDVLYLVAQDIFTLYAPTADNQAYYPGPVAIGSANTAFAYRNNHYYTFRTSLRRRNLGTNSTETLIADVQTQSGASLIGDHRNNFPGHSGHNKDGGYLWFLDDNCELYTCDITGSSFAFVHRPTTGLPPQSINSRPAIDGVCAAIDESRNVLVAFISRNITNATATGAINVGRTHVLDLDTWEWRAGPWRENGDTVPGMTEDNSAAGQVMMYDRLKQRILKFHGRDSVTTEIWEFKPRFKARWTSFELPASSGSVYGVNYRGFPFLSNSSSKNVNIAYCPLTDRLYATGGDTLGSDTPGIWSMSMTDGSWRLDLGTVTTPWAFPQPNGIQDFGLFVWDSVRQRFQFGWNYSEPYDVPGSWERQYARGVWWYDPSVYPATDAWFQDLSRSDQDLSPNAPYNNVYGGWYDAQNDMLVGFGSGGNSATTVPVWRIDIGTMATLSDLSCPVQAMSGFSKRPDATGYVELDRWLYALTVYTDGTTTNRVLKMIRYNLDTGAGQTFDMHPLAPQGSDIQTSPYMKLEKSNGKVVWLHKSIDVIGGLYNIFIFDPATLEWTVDESRPAYGSVAINTSCSLPDGRIVMAGGGSSHIWFYTAP